MNTFLSNIWTTILQPVVLTVAIGYAGILAQRVNSWLGLKNEAQLRDAFHKAAENAVKYATNQILTRGDTRLDPDEIVSMAKRYVRTKNPETLKSLKVSDTDLTEILTAKLSVK